MDYNQIKEAMTSLEQAIITLEETYIESEGEVTEETEAMENNIANLKQLLTTEGIDMLGGWLKAKEDKKKSLKAEKDHITRQMSAIDQSIDFIKGTLNEVMRVSGIEKIKGNRGYSFTATTSTKTEVDKEVLKNTYAGVVESAIREAGVPAYVGVTLTASSTKADEVGLLEEDCNLFVTTQRPSVRFTKPRVKEG